MHLPGQHSRADPGWGAASPKAENVGQLSPLLSAMQWCGWGRDVSPQPSPTATDKSADSPPNQLQHLGKWALHLAWTAELTLLSRCRPI